MRVPGPVVRAELRRRSSLAALALVVALVVVAVGGALAAARSTASSIERFREWAAASDGLFQLNDAGPTARLQPEVDAIQRRIVATGAVRSIGPRWLVNGFFDHGPIPDIAIYSDPTDRFARTIERPRVLHGRMPHRGAPDEIALNEQAASLLHAGPGSRVTLRTWTSRDLANLFAGNAFPGFNGPVLHLRVVGVTRTLDGLSGNIERGSPYGFAGPRFLAAHPDVGPWPPAVYVRTRDGAAGFTRLSRTLAHDPTLAQHLGTGTSAGAQYLDGVQHGADGSATGLLVFALVAAVAGALVAGQAVQRHLADRATEGRHLVELGLTRTATAVTLTLPVVIAAVAGSVGGGVIAAVGSRWSRIGVAGRAEIDRGAHLDLPVLLGCAVLAVLLVAGFGIAWARARIARVGPPPSPTRRVTVAVRAALALGAPPSVATGVQLATDRTAESGPVPLRTAFAGVALAVIAVVAAGVVVRSDDVLVTHPERWGRPWSSEPDAFGGRSVADQARRLAGDRRIAAAALFASGSVRVGGHDTAAYALSPLRHRIDLTILRGRLPTRPDEVALGEHTLADTHAAIGDRLRVGGPGGYRADLLVSGTVVLPPTAGENHTLDSGALMVRSTLARLVGRDNLSEDVVLRYPSGADTPRLERALARDYDVRFNAFTRPQLPGSVRRLADTRSIAVALAWFFAALGLLSLVHALWVGTRRRRIHLTMLRVLGMRRAQVLTAVLVQAGLLVTLAVVVGVPVGLLVGRTAWRAATNGLGAVTDAAAPWAVIATVLPVAVLAGLGAAWWPGWRVGRRRPAETLHVE